jgi:hypothetical protein
MESTKKSFNGLFSRKKVWLKYVHVREIHPYPELFAERNFLKQGYPLSMNNHVREINSRRRRRRRKSIIFK